MSSTPVPLLKRQYTIALMVIAGIFLLVVGVNYLKGIDLFNRSNVYHAVYTDVSGINDATPVLYHGFKVGQVVGTELMPDGSGRIAVAFQFDEKRLRITKDSKLELFSADLFTRAARLQLGNGPTAEQGDTLNGGAELSLTESVSSQIDPLKRKAEGMLASVDSVLSALQQVLNKEARGDIDASFANLRGTLENINATTKKLDLLIGKETQHMSNILANMDRLSGTLAANHGKIDHILTNVDSATTALANGRMQRMMTDLEGTMAELKATMAKLNGGEGTLGKLMTDDSLYVNLNGATREMELLLEDMRLNPHRYLSIFGRKDKLPKLSGSDIERIRQAYPPSGKP
jgi:phospholipid/cholesterol/gamma-HCH transport system substrate-binding protein